ncbi:MAG: hypothetical protein MI685_08500 [Chlorobiales bacterium]|nr:hypothetical protein [Chlorobiales bacterium]
MEKLGEVFMGWKTGASGIFVVAASVIFRLFCISAVCYTLLLADHWARCTKAPMRTVEKQG